MKSEEIQEKLAAARQEMQEVLQEKVLLDLRIGHLSETINALTAMLQPVPDSKEFAEMSGLPFGDTGISGAIRLLLTRSKVPLAPMQIRTELMNHGFDLSDYTNAMAVIHNTLKRLDRQGELMTVKDAGGNVVAYATRWVGPGSADRAGMRG